VGEVAGEVADAGVGYLAPGSVQPGLICLGADLGRDSCGLAVEDRGEVAGDPGFGFGDAGLVEAVRRAPDVLGHVDKVQQDVHLGFALVGFGLDQLELVAGAVDQHHPVAQMVPVTGLGLVERGGDHVLGRLDQRGGQPFAVRFRPRSRCSPGAAALGWGDHIVRPSRSGIGVEHAGQRGHPLAVWLLARGQSRAKRPPVVQVRFARRGPQCLGPHHDALAVDLEDERGGGGRRERDLVLVEGVDVGCRGDDELLGLPLAQDFPAAAVDRFFGLVVGAANGFADGQAAQAVEVRADGQRELRVGRVHAGLALAPPCGPRHGDHAEHAGRQAGVAHLAVRADLPVRTTDHPVFVCRICSRSRRSRRSRWRWNSSRSNSRP
jgi:hypothetical protein